MKDLDWLEKQSDNFYKIPCFYISRIMKTRKIIKLYIYILFSILLTGFYACEDNPNEEPTCSIIFPINGDEIDGGDILTISVIANDPDGELSKISIIINGIQKSTCSGSPCQFNWDTSGENSGSYNITVTAYDNNGSSTNAETIVYIKYKPVADFILNNENISYISIMEGTSITFNDITTNNPTEWLWNFGDGASSTEQNPTHIYVNEGLFTVSLTASNSDGSGTKIKPDLIKVNKKVMNIPCPDSPTVTDKDGNVYKTVQIGSQCWMAENLRVGIPIDGSLDQTNNGIIEKYSYNNLITNCDIYGGLYQWDEMMQYNAPNDYESFGTIKGICPDGWHIPTSFEINLLISYLGGTEGDVGGKLKESGLSHWSAPNYGATNESGFTALPSGTRNEDGSFTELGEEFIMWSSQRIRNSSTIDNMGLSFDNPWYYAKMFPNSVNIGWAVRCIKDR